MKHWTGPAVWLRRGLLACMRLMAGVPWLARAGGSENGARQVSPSAWYAQGLSAAGSSANQNFISYTGFVVTAAGVVVINALGSPALATRLLAEIATVTALPVTHVIVTHYHVDHVYGLQVFRRWARGWWRIAPPWPT
jgi:glyoxylase-like metal-dependent hydrolase (beta-lactamase superfamily II)